jgi:hypothetical protein
MPTCGMDDQPKRYWFSAKRYGWGWGPPTSWQGWLVFFIWLAVLLPVSIWLAPRSLPLFFLFEAAMIALLITVCYIKGEPRR